MNCFEELIDFRERVEKVRKKYSENEDLRDNNARQIDREFS